MGQVGSREFGIVELASGMRKTGDFAHVRSGQESVVASVGICLQISRERTKESLRTIATAIRREVIHCVRMPDIADLDPETRRSGTRQGGIEHRNGGIVCVDDLRSQYLDNHQVVERREQFRARSHPSAHRTAPDIHSVARQHFSTQLQTAITDADQSARALVHKLVAAADRVDAQVVRFVAAVLRSSTTSPRQRFWARVEAASVFHRPGNGYRDSRIRITV